MVEEWLTIKGFKDRYLISNKGNVKSLVECTRNAGKNIILKPVPNKHRHNYLQVGLWKDGKKHPKKIHILVAEHFLKRIKGKNHINHINGDKKKNNVNNLEWCTPKENIEHGIRTGLIDNFGENSKISKLKEKEVVLIRASKKPQQELAEKYNISQSNVSMIRRNMTWKHLKLQ